MKPSYQATPVPFRRSIVTAFLLLALPCTRAQVAPTAPSGAPPEDSKKPIPVEVTVAKPSDEVVALSPFEVVSETKGYYATNTMSGTRFNSKLDDLASSISVVTKEQMSDFAMLDINDVFAYTGGTEGTHTYTDTVIDRNGSVSDNVQLNPQGANRIRGIAPANISLNNIETMGRVPLDPIALDAVEISRGPNANVFGLGNPSGTVNQVAAAANVTRDRSQVQFRADSYGGYRSSLDANRVLLRGKLAIRGSAVFQHDGYERKPSGTNTERFNGMIKYKPFKNTTIAAFTSFYRMNGNRPNALTPRDNISYWIQNGRPTWDPTTQQIHINGVTVGTFTATTYNGPDYFSATLLGGTRSQMFIDQNGLSYWSAPQGFANVSALLPGTTVLGPTSGGQAVRFLQTTGIAGATGTAVKPSAQPLFVTSPAINNKGYYDWTAINIASPNRLMDRTITSNVQIDQIILNSQRQKLAAQVGFLREDSQRYTRNLIGIANDLGQSGQVEIDPNEKLLDGSPNPYFLRPFIGTDKPRTVWAPAKWDTYRAQVAYQLDLTHESNLLKWLGVQQVTGYDEYKYRINRQYSFRDAMLDPKAWLQPGVYRGAQTQVAGTPALVGLTQGFYRYYLSNNQGTHVDYAPQEFNNNGTYKFVWGNGPTATGPAVWNSEPTTMGLAATNDASGGNSNSKTILKTVGIVLQSHYLSDALVVTLGRREDRLYSRVGNLTGAVLNADGETFNYPLINSWNGGDWSKNGGKTTNVQFALRPFRDLPFLRSVDERGGGGHYVASALRGLSVYYNTSDSFVPQGPAQDLFGKILPNTTGKDKSIGFGLNLLDGKVVMRVTHYDTAQLNVRNGDTNTVNGRVIRIDLPYQGSSGTKFQLLEVAGGTSTADFTQSSVWGPNNNQAGWIATVNPTWTPDQIKAEFIKQSGLTAGQIATMSGLSINPSIAGTNDVAARGTEVEMNVNLTPSWTVAANFTETKAYVRNVSSTLQKWIDLRMPFWTKLVDQAADVNWTQAQLDAEPQHLWWTHNYGGTQTAQQNFNSFVATPYSVIRQLDGQANPQTARYSFKASTNFRLSGITEHHVLKHFNVGGAVRWQSRAAIGFFGVPDANGIYQTIDTRRPIWGTDHYYFDALVGYRTKLWADKVGATFQLNVQNIFENGGSLQAVGAYPNGTPNNFRIIDPRQFLLTATFDL